MIKRGILEALRFLATWLVASVLGSLVATLGFLIVLFLQEAPFLEGRPWTDILLYPLLTLFFASLMTPLPALVLYLVSRFIRVTLLNYLLLGTVMGVITAVMTASLMLAPVGGFSFTVAFGAVFLMVFLAICLPASMTGALVFYRQARQHSA
ncbi:hypothetical protein V6L76_01255 [Pannonibacter sp. Pt2]|uniref:Uncharacterized protein n=1 Tax=Pannonibacter anstelovis TaxID=3121537 RepID=A0ABU7ZIB4_9HYPH